MKKHCGQKKLEISYASQILTNEHQTLVLSQLSNYYCKKRDVKKKSLQNDQSKSEQQGKLRTKRYLKQHCTLNVICSGINKYHSFSDIIDMAFNGQGCRLCCPNQPTGGAVSLNGCHNHRPEGPILKRSQIQGHTLGDYSLTNQATNLKFKKNSKINAFKFRFFGKINLFCFTLKQIGLFSSFGLLLLTS